MADDRRKMSITRLYDNTTVNLHHAMDTLGFTLAIKEHLRYNPKHRTCCDICVMYIDNCHCCEDLYVLYRD